jgi:Family of unknown function (DUF6065)
MSELTVGENIEKELDVIHQKSPQKTPLVTFFRLIPEARIPQRADQSAAGLIPTRAFRYCEAIRSASAFGWYVFPPITFSLMWDGKTNIMWSYKGTDEWYPVTSAQQFPDFAARFDNVAPPALRGFSPPFLGTNKDAGFVQIWSGLIARTAPEWSLLIRPPANFVQSLSYDYYEGIVETDHWYGPLFINIRLGRTDTPIHFDADFPYMQVQPVYRTLYGKMLDNFVVEPDLEKLDWEAFQKTVVLPNIDPHRQRGEYAVNVRKRNKQNIV